MGQGALPATLGNLSETSRKPLGEYLGDSRRISANLGESRADDAEVAEGGADEEGGAARDVCNEELHRHVLAVHVPVDVVADLAGDYPRLPEITRDRSSKSVDIVADMAGGWGSGEGVATGRTASPSATGRSRRVTSKSESRDLDCREPLHVDMCMCMCMHMSF